MSICNAYSVLLCWKYALCVKVEDVFWSGIENLGGDRVTFHSRNGKPGRFEVRFGRGMENPAGLRYIFSRGMENRMGIGPRFVRGIENRMRIGPRFVRGMDFWVGMGFIRPLAWPLVGRIQYAPTLTDENSSGFGFVFIRCRRKSPFFRVFV